MTPLPKPCAVHGIGVPAGRRARRPRRRVFRKPDLPPAPAWMRCAVIGFATGAVAALLYTAGMFDPLRRLLAWYGLTWGG